MNLDTTAAADPPLDDLARAVADAGYRLATQATQESTDAARSNDGNEFKAAMELNQDQVTGSFKDPDGEPEVLVVVDMLLTGFDAPVEQVLYLDRAIPNPKALPYLDRFKCLTEIRSYARAHFLQEDALLDWTDIGAKVKKLIDERIDAEVRELMKPVSVLDQDFDQKIAALPHDEARASVMEHTIRAYINEKLADNPVFYGKLSEQLERIIQDLRNKVIDAADAAKLQAALKAQLDAEEDIAAQMGLSSESFAIYEIIGQGGTSMISEGDRSDYHVRMDEEQKEVTEKVVSALSQHRTVVDWQTNVEVQRLKRRDIKRVLRDDDKYTEAELDDLANRIVDAFRSRGTR